MSPTRTISIGKLFQFKYLCSRVLCFSYMFNKLEKDTWAMHYFVVNRILSRIPFCLSHRHLRYFVLHTCRLGRQLKLKWEKIERRLFKMSASTSKIRKPTMYIVDQVAYAYNFNTKIVSAQIYAHGYFVFRTCKLL